MTGNRQQIGLFSTLPVEAVLAAGLRPVDLNNVFVGAKDAGEYLAEADRAGVPATVCAWTRGLFGAVKRHSVSKVILVGEGDCSANHGLGQLLSSLGAETLVFDYPSPWSPTPRKDMLRALNAFCAALGTTLEQAEMVRKDLLPTRQLFERLDRATWEEGRVSGRENWSWLLSSTDFCGAPNTFQSDLQAFVAGLETRKPAVSAGPRLGIFGVPNVFTDLPERLAGLGATMVYAESPYDFAMTGPAEDLVSQYLALAWPYGATRRLERARTEARRRELDGFIVYNQQFCHHGFELPLVTAGLGLPTLVLEGGDPGPLEQRDLLRLEAFLAGLRPVAGAGRRPSKSQARPVSVGLDLGSRFAKLVVQADRGIERTRLDSMDFYRRFVRRDAAGFHVDVPLLLEQLFGQGGVQSFSAVVCGYGRHLVGDPAVRVVTEVLAHARGAVIQSGQRDLLLVDVGGQDSKVITIRDGRVQGFAMNDKCAAGSGRYVENMARVLGLPLAEFLGSEARPVTLSSTCATFGEAEALGLIVEGVEPAMIAAGVLAAVAGRVAGLCPRAGETAGLPVLLSGGVAASPVLVRFLSERLGSHVKPLPDPEFNGALGCLNLAMEDGDGSPVQA